VANFSQGTIQMYYDTDDGVADKNTLLVAHDNGISQWQNFGGVATNNWTGSITSAIFNNFHTFFALGNPPGGGNPLPVELTSFTAKLVNKSVYLNWTTQSEINNDYFTVERSPDNITWASIGTVDGHGTSTEVHNYQFVDNDPLRGISYYRLRQTDFDGHQEILPVALVNNSMPGTFTVYPNPALSPVIHLNGDDVQLKYYTITVTDITGRIIPATVDADENSSVTIMLEPSAIQSGQMYFVTATDGQHSLKQKFVVQ
jgi:hypothetical protein